MLGPKKLFRISCMFRHWSVPYWRFYCNCFHHEVSSSSVVQNRCAVRGASGCASVQDVLGRNAVGCYGGGGSIITTTNVCVQHYKVYPPCVTARPARRRSALVCARAATRAGTVSTGTTAERQRHCKPTSSTTANCGVHAPHLHVC